MKVSVVMTTYNQEAYVAQAVESVLMQEVTFEFELIIIEDFSTDRTREIVIDYQRQHPHLIKLILADRNRNDSRNFAHTIETSQSQYIALLEGDDYWTSPHKLQKQIEFLDGHPECSSCFHNALKVFENGSQPPRPYNRPDQKPLLTFEDILVQNVIATCSIVFRRGLFGRFPEWYFALPIGDWPLHILNAEHGTIGYLDELMGVYRIHPLGLWSRLSDVQKIERTIQFYHTINSNLNFKHDRIIQKLLAQRYYDLSLAYEKNGDLENASLYLSKSLAGRPDNLSDYLGKNGHLTPLLWQRLNTKLWFYRHPLIFYPVKRFVDYLKL